MARPALRALLAAAVVVAAGMVGPAVLAGPAAADTIDPNSVWVDVPQSVVAGTPFTVSVLQYDPDGSPPRDITALVTLTLDDTGPCAGATCTPTREGDDSVTATYEGQQVGESDVSVTPGPIAALSPYTPWQVNPGTPFQAGVSATDAYGNPVDLDPASVTFSIVGVGPCDGTTCTAPTGPPYSYTLEADHDGLVGTTDLQLPPPLPDTLALGPTTVLAGASFTPTASASLGGQSWGDVSGATLFSITGGTCDLDNECVAPSTPGTYTLTGTYYSDFRSFSATSPVAVEPVADHLVVSASAASVGPGGTVTLGAHWAAADGSDLGDVSSLATFSVNGGGSCTGTTCTLPTTAGTYTVSATDPAQPATGSIAVTVVGGPLDHLAVSAGAGPWAAGTARSVTARGSDAWGNDLGDLTSTTTFTLDGGTCAGGTCSSTVAGPTQLHATSVAASGVIAVTLTPGPIVGVRLSPGSTATGGVTSTVTAGGTQAFTVAGVDRYGNSTGDVTGSTTLTIASGTCTGATCKPSVKVGTYTVTATATTPVGKKTDRASLTVVAGSTTRLTVSPSTISGGAGTSTAFSAKATDAYGNVTDSSAVVWTVAGSGASCNGSSCGATVAGVHTVTATLGALRASARLTVVPGPAVGLRVNPTATVVAGTAVTFVVATVDQYGNATALDPASAAAATVDPGSTPATCTGLSCSSTAAGSVTLTVHAAGFTAPVGLRVRPAAVTTVAVLPGLVTVAPGVSKTFTVHATDRYGNTVTTTPALTVDGGTCTGLQCTSTTPGDHTVTATVAGVTGTAILRITGSSVKP